MYAPRVSSLLIIFGGTPSISAASNAVTRFPDSIGMCFPKVAVTQRGILVLHLDEVMLIVQCVERIRIETLFAYMPDFHAISLFKKIPVPNADLAFQAGACSSLKAYDGRSAIFCCGDPAASGDGSPTSTS